MTQSLENYAVLLAIRKRELNAQPKEITMNTQSSRAQMYFQAYIESHNVETVEADGLTGIYGQALYNLGLGAIVAEAIFENLQNLEASHAAWKLQASEVAYKSGDSLYKLETISGHNHWAYAVPTAIAQRAITQTHNENLDMPF